MNFKNSKIALFVFSLGAVALVGCNNKPVTSKVTITFDGNGGTVTPANGNSVDVTVDKGTLFKDVKAPKAEKNDYTFDAWTSTKDDITTKVKDDYAFNNNVTLFAYYTEVSSYTYKFVDGDKTIKEETIKKGAVIVAPEDLDEKHAKDTEDEKYYHYTFDDWYDSKTEEKFVEGTKISGDVTYNAKFNKGGEVEHVPGKQPTCSEPGFEEAYKCKDCAETEGEYVYYDAADSIEAEHLIGDEDAYTTWKTSGAGYIAPTGQHNYQPEFKGTYKTTYNALETFDTTGLEVCLHCSYETEHDNDISITNYEVKYEANDGKLHVNNGDAYVTFTYDNKEYKKDLELTVSAIEVDEPAAGTTSFVFTGSEITYTVAESDKYAISNNKQTNVGSYNATISLTDKGGDYVWKTSETTADLSYPFSITKASNAITGLAESYTTTCHTAPTIENVTSTFGTVQYKYYKTADGVETEVTVDEIEKANGVTYRVKAYVTGTDNYDAAEQYATLTVNHGWGDPYSPTDHIGKKLHACVCGAVEETDSLMESGDVNFKASTFGIKVKKVTSEGEEDHGSVALAGDGTRATFDVNNTNTFKIYLPLTNFDAFETNVTFNMKVISGYFYLGFSSSTKYYTGDGDLLYGVFEKDGSSFKLVATRNGSAIFNESITITDTDILNGTKPLGLYVDCAQPLVENRVVTFLSTELDECSHPLVIPTDHIGYKKCAVCDLESEELMTSGDVNFKNYTYGISLKQVTDGGEVAFGNIDHSAEGTRLTFNKSDNDLKLYLPLTNYSAFDTNVTFKFRADCAWFSIGLSEDNLFSTTEPDPDDGTRDTIYVIYRKADNSVSLVVDRGGAKAFENSTTITDADILNGSKSLPLIIKNTVDGRVITFLNAQLDECNHEFIYAPTDHIGYKKCALCDEETTLMEDSDIKINAKDSYGANAAYYYSTSQEGVWGMTWGHDGDSGLHEHEMKFPKVMFKEYSTVTFNFTTNENFTGWSGPVGVGTSSENYDLIPYTAVRDALSGKITATYNTSTQELTLTAYDVTAQNGETQLGTKTITISNDVASGNENLKLYLKVNSYRAFGITSVNVTTE